MRILVIDTHSPLSSVGLLEEDTLIGEISIEEKYTHSDHLIPMIEDLFLRTKREIQQVDAFVVCSGPGSFTGLRIGMTTAKTFAQLFEKPVVGISTLEALANKVYSEKTIIPIVDGRGGNVYYGYYRWEKKELVQKKAPGFMACKELLKEAPERRVFIGEDTALFPELVEDAVPRPVGGLITSIGQLALKRLEKGDVDDTFALSPEYLRLSQAQRDYLKKQKKQVPGHGN